MDCGIEDRQNVELLNVALPDPPPLVQDPRSTTPLHEKVINE